MMSLTLEELAGWVEGQLVAADPRAPVAGMTVDSRQARPGDVFWALPGRHTHGERFVGQAWAKGAVAVVGAGFVPPPAAAGGLVVVDDPARALDRFTRRSLEARRITVVGVTGSVGKTSVKELTRAVLATRFRVGASQGNYNTPIGLALSLFAAPDDATHFVAEMGMRHRGEIEALTRLARPQVAVITRVAAVHLETLGTIEAVREAKAEILLGLRPDGVAVLNADDERVWSLRHRLPPDRVVGVGQGGRIGAEAVRATLAGTRFLLRDRAAGWARWVELPWTGAHQADNAALAAAVGVVLGLSPDDIVAGLQAVPAEAARLRQERVGGMLWLEDLYNASPPSVTAALDVLAPCGGRRVAVLGDMLELGEEETAGHRLVGSYAQGRADVVVAVGPRSRRLAEAAQAAGVPTVHWCADVAGAAECLRGLLRAGDTVLFKASRGMALETLVAGLKAGSESA